MTVRIAINGFGRIGRNIVRALYEYEYNSKITIVAINEIADITSMAYLLQYDTSHGRFSLQCTYDEKQLFIGNDRIHVFHEKNIESLPWMELSIDIVLDCTGIYGNRKDGEAHIFSGAKKVLFSHLGGNDLDATVVYGVNHKSLKSNHKIVSNASCTVNCVIPVIQLLDNYYLIKMGAITVVHSAMNDQQVIDAYSCNLRYTRAASQSVIPIDTKLVNGITRIFPQFNNCFEAIALRVPTINVTAIDLSIIVKKIVKVDELNILLKRASYDQFSGVVRYTELPLVSIDFNHDSHSTIIDGTQTKVCGSHLIKMLIWCDNEWGFANRMLDTTLAMYS